jgi:hypothetical protein
MAEGDEAVESERVNAWVEVAGLPPGHADTQG